MTDSKAFSAIYLSIALSYLGVGLVAPLIPILLAGHGENSLIVGLIGTTMFSAFTLASFPVGAATDHIGAKPILIAGLIVYGTSILLFAFINVTWLFFAVRAVEGVGASAISVATETMINRLSKPEERARRMSYYALAVGIGWAAGPLAGALLYGIRAEVPFIGCFALSVLAALLAVALIQKSPAGEHHGEAFLSVLSPRIVVPISAGALYGYLMSSLVTLFPLYLKREINVPDAGMAAIITAVIIGTIVSQVPIGHAADRFGKRKTLLVCTVLLSGVFALMSLHSDWRLFLATGVFAGALAGSLYPMGLALIGQNVRKARLGAATSTFSLAFGIGSLVGPSASGFAMTQFDNPKWLLYIPALLSGAFAVVIVLLYGKTVARAEKAVGTAAGS
ncbi:MAG TPA: MFS transporter [Blastocatellia bacterium]|nr:MFS transporter [Blastocatellia bacterium]